MKSSIRNGCQLLGLQDNRRLAYGALEFGEEIGGEFRLEWGDIPCQEALNSSKEAPVQMEVQRLANRKVRVIGRVHEVLPDFRTYQTFSTLVDILH